MPTIKEVARRAGVSIGTASHVLNGTVPVSDRLRKKVEGAVAALDYSPSHVARSLATKRTHTIAAVIPDITNPFFPQVIRGVESVVAKAGYSILTFNTDDCIEREREALAFLRSRRVDGLLLVIAPGRNDGSHIRGVLNAGISVVCLDRIPSGIPVDSVSADNFGGAQGAVRHLIAQGHRDIAILTGPLTLRNARDRLKGYKAALREAGIPISEDLIATGDFREDTGSRLCQEMFAAKKHRPSAIFASNNLLTLGALEALSQLGLRCPEDVAFVTFDGSIFPDVFRPTITTVVQAAYQIGVRGAELLMQRLGNELSPDPVRIKLPTELRIKESTLRRYTAA